jgi:hypothetical protein
VSRWPVAGPSGYWLLASSSASKVTPAIHTQDNKYIQQVQQQYTHRNTSTRHDTHKTTTSTPSTIYNLQVHPAQFTINTETCRSNFNINVHYLFVPMLVYNTHLFVNMMQGLALNCKLTRCSKRLSHISLQGRWNVPQTKGSDKKPTVKFHRTRGSYNQARHRRTAQSDCQGVLQRLKIRSSFIVARPRAVPSNEFKVQRICNNPGEVMWDEFAWIRTRTSGALLWTP